jgi:hypothetical protein
MLARRRAMPVVAILLVAGVAAALVASIAEPARAGTDCPPPSAAATTVPTVSPTSSPSAPTTTPSPTTATSPTTTTVEGTPPTANSDDDIFPVGQAFSVNVLANDDLGDPPATISTFTLAPPATCAGVSFDPGAGELSGTLSVPLLPCILSYTLENAAGSSSTVATLTGSQAP